jgi:outer membrane receptor protein involved in Fe transport
MGRRGVTVHNYEGKAMGCINSVRRYASLSRAVALALGTSALTPALAQTVQFNLPEEDAVAAIPEFARQANLQIIAPADKLRGIRTHSVTGALDARTALSLLLQGTGITVASDDGHIISLRLADRASRTGAPAGADANGPRPAEGTGVVAGGTELEEVVVTATRRTENLQNVPIAITALTGTTLNQLNVQTLDDFVKFLPNVSTAGLGPGQSEVYMRGLSTTHQGNQVAGGTGAFPNVAVYLDDQSAQLPGRNLDIYAADLERIEILEGPQGTLYGAGAQAGAVRYITNKPKLDAVEAGANASYSTTAHGDPSSAVQAFLNVPVIADTLALRAVIYDDSRGGYIHNVPGTFVRSSSDAGIAYYFNGVVPPGSQTLSNANVVSRAFNPVTYKGIRASALYKFNDDWNLLLEQSYQNMEADGVFAYDPTLGDLNIQQYNPSWDKDRFEDTAWTINGRAGPLKLVYTGGYLVRNVDEVSDYTAYSRGPFAPYYQCNLTTPVCYSPSATWHNVERNAHQSHEIRVSTPDESRLRAIGGVFWEDYRIQTSQNFLYGSPQAGFSSFGPVPGVPAFDPNPRPAGTVFFTDLTRGYQQKAAFGELAFDLVPKSLVLTVGTRFYHFDNFDRGQSDSEYGCRNVSPCAPPNGIFDVFNFSRANSGHKSKANLSWKPADEVLIYATYSEGFRPGGFNQGAGVIPKTSPLYGIFTIPRFYDSDDLKNYELGWKTQWFGHRLQFNGALYDEEWSNVQLQIYDPALYGNAGFTVNGPHYRVRGIEGDVEFRVTAGLTVDSSFAWNRSQQVNEPSLNVGGGEVTLFPTRGVGSPLANAPPFQGNVRARYELPYDEYLWHVQAAAQHTDHSYADVITQGALQPPDYELAPYTTYDASVGVSKDAWEAEFYGQNLTDTRAQLFISSQSYVALTTVNRPRVLGVRFSYKFKGGH